MGMRVFSLQDPSTRTYLNEWAFMANLRDEDVLSVGYDFVYVVQNGQPMGVYAVEEGFAKELLEAQNRRESVIIRYNEDLLWETWAALDNDLMTSPGLNTFYLIDEFGSSSVDADPVMSARRDAAVGKLRGWWEGELSTGEVFDVERTARFWALADFWGAKHALIWHNLRYYFNHITGRLEPIGFDAQPLIDGPQTGLEELPGRLELLRHGDARLQRAYVEALQVYTDPAYLAALEARYGDAYEAYRDALWPEFGEVPTAWGGGVLDAPWESLAIRAASLREWLGPLQMTYAYVPVGEAPADGGATADGEATAAAEAATELWLDVGNLLDLPVQVEGVLVGEMWLPADGSWRTPGSAHLFVAPAEAGDDLVLRALMPDGPSMAYARLRTPGVVPESEEPLSVQLVTRIWGHTDVVTQPVMSSYPPVTAGALPPAPALAEALASHPYLVEDADHESMLFIPPGVHEISGTLVLPEGYGLRLGPGTTLIFGTEGFLLARGPLTFQGTEDEPVVLQPRDAVWHGAVVLNAGAPSHWRHVTVRDTTVIERPGWDLTGALTFYESPIFLDHCRILGTIAEDALNAIRTTFRFADTEFADTVSDAFDGDFAQGEITRSSFHHIGGDAIDVSGSQITVSDVRIYAVDDKGLSIGEGSHLRAERVNIEGCDYGVASKDLSHAEVREITVIRPRVAALAAYIKKPAYGAASITADAMHFVDVPEDKIALVQTGSWIDLEGERIWGIDIDVDELYGP